MLSVPDISGDVFRYVKASVDANELDPCAYDKSYLCRVISNYIADKSGEMLDEERFEFIRLGRDTYHQVENLEVGEVDVLLAILQGFALAENADGCGPTGVWTDFITEVYGENSDQSDEAPAEPMVAVI